MGRERAGSGLLKLMIWFLPLVLVPFSSRPLAAKEIIWQIGVFDESSSEFSGDVDPVTDQRRIDYSNPAQDPVFVVGRSDPARDWFAFQPGSSNGRAGYRLHPFTIQFELPEAPQGAYTLKIALLAYAPRLPKLQVEINGHRGWFYQHPKLAYSAGDQWVFYLPYYSTDLIQFQIPTRFLHQGTNRLVLTALSPMMVGVTISKPSAELASVMPTTLQS